MSIASPLQAAVLPAAGIGDALLMTIAAYHLSLAGYHVVCFHNSFGELASWFPYCDFAPSIELANLDLLKSFDLVIVENDNTLKMRSCTEAFHTGKIKKLSLFYPTYSASKHSPLSPYDRVFFPNKPMAYNIGYATRSLLETILQHSSSQSGLCNNGILPPKLLQHRIYAKRILLHPTSREPKKNWSQKHFLKLALQLKKRGYEPHFCMSPSEREEWASLVAQVDCPFPNFPTLSDFAAYIYESEGLIGNDSFAGHLASNLQIPTITIANDDRRMQLWRPGWLMGELVLPPQWIPNPRFLKWKENHWSYFVPVRSVLRTFDKKFI